MRLLHRVVLAGMLALLLAGQADWASPAPALAAAAAVHPHPPPHPRPHRPHPHRSVRPPSLRTLRILTVPQLPAVRFALDGVPLTTDDTGVAEAVVPRSHVPHRLELLTPHLATSDEADDFVRWVGRGDSDQGFTPVLPNLVFERDHVIQVAFQTSRLVPLGVVDQTHRPVDPVRIRSLTLRSDSGSVQTLHGIGPVRLTSTRPVIEAGEAVGREVTYYVESLVIDGANVVNAGEQRLRPSRGGAATVVVLLRSATLQVHDLLFGGPISTDTELTYPDGRVEQVAVGPQGADLTRLARGHYRIAVPGHGYAPIREVALSRSQRVDLAVLSYLDMAVLAGAGLLLVTGLFLWRRHRLRAVVRRAEQRP